MATKRSLICERCGVLPATGGTLFDDLRERARGDACLCPRCQRHHVELRLEFDFGLNASDTECTVRDCFVPRHLESWSDTDGSNVTFYPFLVILQRHGRKGAMWLPYWHTIQRDGRKPAQKYGQWAPFMDCSLFEDLLAQARAKGHLPGTLVDP